MSIKPYHKRAFSQKEWDEADDMGRLYIHLIEPIKWPLTEYLQTMLERYKGVWGVMMGVKSPRSRIIQITYAYGVGERQAYDYIKQAKYLFGEVLDIDPWVERRAAYDRLIRLSELAEANDDYEVATKAMDKAMALLDRIEANTPQEAKIYQPITITTNPTALKSRIEAEDADYIDINATIPKPEATALLYGGEAV
jgi:hypothetical protein